MRLTAVLLCIVMAMVACENEPAEPDELRSTVATGSGSAIDGPVRASPSPESTIPDTLHGPDDEGSFESFLALLDVVKECWASQGLTSYRFRFAFDSDSMDQLGLEHDVVDGVPHPAPDTPPGPQPMTVPEVFAEIRESAEITRSPVEVEVDPEYCYPARLSYGPETDPITSGTVADSVGGYKIAVEPTD